MNTTTIHVKTDIKTRNSAKKVAEDFGFSLTALINVLLKHVVKTKKISLDLNETPNKHTIAALKKSEEDVKAGRVLSFNTPKDALVYLDKEIQNEKRKHSTAH